MKTETCCVCGSKIYYTGFIEERMVCNGEDVGLYDLAEPEDYMHSGECERKYYQE